MASLESLSNPLERLNTLPTALQARGAAGDITWDPTLQYYRGDLVISTITGGAYIFTGGASERSAILGGSDPSQVPLLWTRVQGNGPAEVFPIPAPAPIVPVAGPPPSIPLPAGATLTVPAGSVWSVSIQGTTNQGGAISAADYPSFTFTPNGAGAVAATVDIVPLVGPAAQNWSASAVVVVGTGGTTITPSGTYAGAAATNYAGVIITYTRLI